MEGGGVSRRPKIVESHREDGPEGMLLEIRHELQAAAVRRRASLSRRLAQAQREQRRRTSAKEKRVWPRRVPHKAPKTPHFLTLSAEQKALQEKVLRETG